VYQLHEHGRVFLSTFAPPSTFKKKLNTLLFSKAFQLPPPLRLDYHSFINCIIISSFHKPLPSVIIVIIIIIIIIIIIMTTMQLTRAGRWHCCQELLQSCWYTACWGLHEGPHWLRLNHILPLQDTHTHTHIVIIHHYHHIIIITAIRIIQHTKAEAWLTQILAGKNKFHTVPSKLTTLCPIKKHTKIVLVISSTKIN